MRLKQTAYYYLKHKIWIQLSLFSLYTRLTLPLEYLSLLENIAWDGSLKALVQVILRPHNNLSVTHQCSQIDVISE